MTLSAVHARSLVDLAGENSVELLIGYPYHYRSADAGGAGIDIAELYH